MSLHIYFLTVCCNGNFNHACYFTPPPLRIQTLGMVLAPSIAMCTELNRTMWGSDPSTSGNIYLH